MSKKLSLLFIVLSVFFSVAQADNVKYVVSMDNTKDWWIFDMPESSITPNAIMLGGSTKNWYVGGVGTYIAKEKQDLSKYDTIQLNIMGIGEKSGTLKIELYDDDNNNWKVEQDEKNNYAPTKDDKFIYDQIIDWKGWKTITILIADFVDDNPKVGDGIMNFEQKGQSGGLLQIQFICSAATDKGSANLGIKNICLLKKIIKEK